MKEPHNYRAVGWSMVAVAGSLAIIGVISLFIADDPYFSDRIMKDKEKEFEERKNLEMEEELKGTEFNVNLQSTAFAAIA